MRAAVVEAEAEVPKALAEALRTGRMGIMDYYDMENLKADTRMRTAIAGEEKSERLDKSHGNGNPTIPRNPNNI